MTGYIEIVNGDLLNATEPYIAHQCNCVSTCAKTLAKIIFDKYSYADTYKSRINLNPSTYHKPGTIDILGDGVNNKYIINMYSQYYPAIAKYSNDSFQKRLQWFQMCLNQIGQINGLTEVAMPYNIGCGAAGGNWNDYFNVIQKFANDTKIKIKLYKIE